METIWLSVSAGTGPEECAHAAALTVRALAAELEDGRSRRASGAECALAVAETEPAGVPGNIRSAALALTGGGAQAFAESWVGVIQWIWRSEYRPHHKRKNWFVSVAFRDAPVPATAFSAGDVRFSTAKAGGPGGQYVNKTESAVRAVHIPTGKSVLVRDERSQGVNKKRALARLAALCGQEQADQTARLVSAARHSHYELVRGNPIRVYETAGDGWRLVDRRRV